MTTSGDRATPADAVTEFFAQHGAASLRLASGWFGRPYDNAHRLSAAAMAGDDLLIGLDELHQLRLQADGSSSAGGVLRIAIRAGHWHWTEYGNGTEHDEPLGPGDVEFHALAR